jgi:signal peptidase II
MIILLVLLDQLTKYLFGNVKNYGASFGILQGYTTFLIIFSLIVIFLCSYYYKHKNLRLALNFILAGTISNLIDRILFSYVRDFIDLKFFPVFNFADVFNCVGVALLIYYNFKK